MIVVLGWCYGFDKGTFIWGVFDSIETARKKLEKQYDGHEARYQDIVLNTIQDFDYYMATPLFEEK